jgi:hypothetical protein
MKPPIVILLVFLILALTSCPEWHRYDSGIFPGTLTNFEALNTQYDDYNSTAPFIYYKQWFHFSSNRYAMDKDFDIVGEKMFIEWSKDNGRLEIGTDNSEFWYDYLQPMFDSVNSDCNELGPYSLGFREDISYSEVLWTDLFLYANDCQGNYDIRFIYSEFRNMSGVSSIHFSPLHELLFLNSGANEMYPTLYGEGFYQSDEWGGPDPGKIQKLLYASDSEGNFNIYEVEVPDGKEIIQTLTSSGSYTITKSSLNSAYDDHCPFTNGKLLVFASNRPGGYGGYDLYFSVRRNNAWSEPKNFGEKINSEFDEFRPIVLYYHDFENNLLLFSSNRPGGKGGFDLYYIGIKQLVR